MANQQIAPTQVQLDQTRKISFWTRAWALAEVLLAFAFVHVTYRSFKHFTALGQLEGAPGLNFSPGITMILFTLAMIVLRRRNFAEYGLGSSGWQYNVNIALLWVVLEVTAVLLFIFLTPFPVDPLNPPHLAKAMAVSLGYLVLTVFLALSLMRDWKFLTRVPAQFSLLILAGFLLLPVFLAVVFQRSPPENVALSVLWLFFGAGFGEEIFFRGYCQSRLNEAFGRPWTLLRVRFGPGLLVASLLFGFIHALNRVDYFAGRYDFEWPWMLDTFFAGLFLGVMRERTGSVLPGALVHGLGDVFGSIPPLLPHR